MKEKKKKKQKRFQMRCVHVSLHVAFLLAFCQAGVILLCQYLNILVYLIAVNYCSC